MYRKDFRKSALWILASVMMFQLYVFGEGSGNDLFVSMGEFLSPAFFAISIFYFVRELL